MAELTVASTTDTQKDIDKAAGAAVEEREPVQEVEQVETEQAETAQPEQPRKSAYQRRIDKLTAEKKEAERRASEAERKLTEGQPRTQAQPQKVEQPQALEAPKKPNRADFTAAKYGSNEAAWDAYEDARDKYAEDIADYKVKKAREDDRRQAAIDKQLADLDAKVEEAKGRRENLLDVIPQTAGEIYGDQGISADLRNLIDQSEVTVDLIYVLGADKTKFADFMKLAKTNPAAAIREVLKLEDQIKQELAGGNASEDEGSDDPHEVRQSRELEEEEELEPQPTARRVSKAPAPIRPVGGSSTKSSVPMDELPYSEYKKLREQQRKNMYRR